MSECYKLEKAEMKKTQRNDFSHIYIRPSPNTFILNFFYNVVGTFLLDILIQIFSKTAAHQICLKLVLKSANPIL